MNPLQQLLSNSNIINVSAAQDIPPLESGMPIKVNSNLNPENLVDMKFSMINFDYFNTLETSIVQGQSFSVEKHSQPWKFAILNETKDDAGRFTVSSKAG